MRESLEQQARDMLERLGHPKAQEKSAGEVVEIANLLNDRAKLRKLETEQDWRSLLVKYIRHVGECEGISYLDDADRHPCGSQSTGFTDEEWKALQNLDREADQLD